MSLFALDHEYQRSIERTWEEFSAHSQAPTATGAEEAERKSHQSVRKFDNHGKVSVQNKTRDAIAPRVEGGSGLIQYDAKAWGCFLDGKRRE